MIIYFISSIWKDDRIEKFENNQWNCLWCRIKFQGINVTKDMAHVLITRDIQIKSFNAAIDQAHLWRYKYLHKYKTSKNNLLNEHVHKVFSFIARIQDKSIEVIENNIHRNSVNGSIYNLSATSETFSFGTSSNTSVNSKPMNNELGRFIFPETYILRKSYHFIQN